MGKKILFFLLLILIVAVIFSFFANFEITGKGIEDVNASKMQKKINVEKAVSEELEKGKKVRVAIVADKKNFKQLKQLLGEKLKDKIKHEFDGIITAEISEEDLNELKQIEDVGIGIGFDIKKINVKQIFLQDTVNIVNASRTWNLKVNGVNLTGKYETVCVVDTGINYSHPDLGGGFGNGYKVIAGYDFCADNDNCTTTDPYPEDVNGHGTHVAGIIAANGRIKGIAPDANIVAIKVCNSAGSCWDDDIKAGIDWCVNNASAFNISVISISLGGGLYNSYCDYVDDPLNITQSIHNAIANNISVIAASGNNYNTTHIASPACMENVTAVAATNKDDTVAAYSNRNNLTDLLAPGTNINSTVPGGYGTKSGTSMATPHVSGAFLLVRQFKRLEKQQLLTPRQLQDALNQSGKTIYDSGSGLNFSRIDVYNAIVSLDETPPRINFVIPTPSNNSLINQSYITINVSIDEISPDTLILVWNNGTETNESFSLKGNFTEWFAINKTLADGNYSFYVFINDSKAYSNATEQRYITVNLPPSINIISPLNQTYNNATILVNISAYDTDLNATWFDWNGTPVAYIEPVNITFNEGLNVLYAYANDSVGNINVTSVAFVVDTLTPPEVLLDWPSNNTFTNQTNIVFNCSASDATGLANITLWLNSSGWHANETHEASGKSNSTSFYKSFGDGVYLWSCGACDSLGNCNTSVENRTLFIDTLPPTISNVHASATATTAVITWQTNEGANSIIKWGTTLDLENEASSSQLTASHSITLTGLSPSTLYYYNVTSCDAAGNCNTSGYYNFTTSASSGGGGGGGGGGAGGGGGGGGGSGAGASVSVGGWQISWPERQEEEIPADINIESTEGSVSINAKKNQKINLRIKNEMHQILIAEVLESRIRIVLYSEPMEYWIYLGSTLFIDIDKDNKNDLAITLESIEGKNVGLLIGFCNCKPCGPWSECNAMQAIQQRTCYKCEKEGCKEYNETRSCVVEMPKQKAKNYAKTYAILLCTLFTLLYFVALFIIISFWRSQRATAKKKEEVGKVVKQPQKQEIGKVVKK
jgi:hypothetical protein